MQRGTDYTRFSVTMTGALLIFLGAAVLANAGDVTEFVVRLVGFSCAIFAVVLFGGHLIRAHSIDAVPFEELIGAGALLLLGAVVTLFPSFFAKALFSLMGVVIVLSGLGDVLRSREMAAADEQLQRVTLRVGIATLAVGAFVTFIPSAALRVVPVLCGVALVLDGLSEIYLALTMGD